MKKILLLLLCSFFTMALFAQPEQAKLLRYPALSPDGTQLAFSWQGDIWTVSTAGGTARRLTIHEAYESNPQWSPDGTKLLFSSSRFGNNDLFTVSAMGGTPVRLTYYSGSDNGGKWIDNNTIIFNSMRVHRTVERMPEIFTISASGGTPTRLLDALGTAPVASPDGRYIAFERGHCRVEREAYVGPAQRDIWLYDTQTKQYIQVTSFDGQDVHPAWGSDNSLYFLSARSGKYNIYRTTINNGKAGEAVALTKRKEMGIRNFDISRKGNKIVFEADDQLYQLNADGKGSPKAIAVSTAGDYRFYPVEQKTLSSGLSDYNVSPNGEQIALAIQGDIFLMPADKDKKRAVRLTTEAARDQEPVWLNDTTLLFVSDRNGSRDIYLMQSSGSNESDLYKTFKRSVKRLTDSPEHESQIVLSPDGKQIAFQRGRGKLIVADISTTAISNETSLLDGWDNPSGISWSPDSKWLAYGLSDLDFNQEIYIHKADNSQKPVNISMHPRGDSNPVWSADGSKLAFISNRNNGDNDVWFAWLKKSDWEKTQRDWEEDEEETGNKKSKKDTILPIQIDFDQIHYRLEQVTSLPANESGPLISKDGETFYFTAFGGGRTTAGAKPELRSVKWNGEDMKTILSGKRVYNLQWDKAHKKVYHLSSGRLALLDPNSKKTESLSFSAKTKLDHMAIREQIFEDAWAAIRDGFYDPEFHGRDWDELKTQYRPLALSASTTQDFRAMFNDMLGQLNASHMGLYGSNPEETQSDRTGQLGIELEPVSNGVKITKVIPNSPADRSNSKLMTGEIITAVNGTPVSSGSNFYSLFEGEAGERVLLDVLGTDGSSREIVIRPTSSLRSELYDSWVQEQRELTEKYSNGRLGYIHIQGMNWPSFERFERELTASGLGKEGIVIDVRYNGGGWTTDMLMTVLNVRQHAYTVPRGAAKSLDKEHKQFREYYPYGERLPLSAWTKPSVALCNEASYSNAEIFSHAYKTLDIGTLVGQPTFGAVISTGGYGLMDGSYIRMPFRAWYVKATEENMENGPAVPDVEVDYPPTVKGSGDDPQLKKAVELLLQEVGN